MNIGLIIGALIAALVVVILLFMWKKPSMPEADPEAEKFAADVQKTYAKIVSVPAKEGMVGSSSGYSAIGDFEHLEDPIEATWQEQIKMQNVDPEVHESHKRFTGDVAVYSRGAARTSLVSDYRTNGLTNFQGLIRPIAVPRRKGLLNQVGEEEAAFETGRTILF